MSTYLQLCQKVARESGTVSGTLPSTVSSQTGRLLKIVNWVNDAWLTIQNERNAWLWMRGEYSASITQSTNRYTGTSFSLSRFADWVVEDNTVTIYETATGVSDENAITCIDWTDYRAMYERGTQTEGRPVHFAIAPTNEICLGPVPDDAYTLRGEYRKSPQTLSADSDEPEMPARFHDAIVYGALILLAEHDEGQLHMATFARRYQQIMSDLRRDQLPRPMVGDALA